MKGYQYSDELDGLRVQAINAINTQTQYTGATSASTLIDSFMTVHDCYGTLAPDTDMSAKLLREAFVEIYRQPILENFTSDVLSSFDDEIEKPEMPEKGELDIEEVLNSNYFFN